MAGERSCPAVGTLKRQARRSLRPQKIKAAPHNSARSLRQDFCSNSKFRKWRNTVCISHFRNCGSGAKRRLRLADAIVRCCLRIKNTLPLQGRQGIWCRCQIIQYIFRCLPVKYPWTAGLFQNSQFTWFLHVRFGHSTNRQNLFHLLQCRQVAENCVIIKKSRAAAYSSGR